MEIKEIEIGGVWTIGNYENVKLAIRYSVENEGELAAITDILGRLSRIVWALRKINDELNENREVIKSISRRLGDLRERKEKCIAEFREKVNEIIEKYKDILKPEVIEEINKLVGQGEYNVCLEKLTHIAECERLPNCSYYINEYEGAVKNINSLKEENNKLLELKNKIHEALKNNDIETAYKLSINYLATKKRTYEEW